MHPRAVSHSLPGLLPENHVLFSPPTVQMTAHTPCPRSASPSPAPHGRAAQARVGPPSCPGTSEVSACLLLTPVPCQLASVERSQGSGPAHVRQTATHHELRAHAQ